MYELRNPVRNADGTIDVEWNHPRFGWIPFTANPGDIEAHGRAIYAELNARDDIPDAPGGS